MWRALGAVLAATAGTAFLSGRQLTLFFSQLGGMSWLAVGTASALFGLCCGALSRFARQTGGENVAAVLMRRLDPRTGAAVGVAHGLLRAVLAGIMLCVAGHMTALLWMAKNAFWMGAAGALLTAALLRMGRGRAALGWMVLALGAAFYLALALDGREVQYATRYEVTLLWRGSAPAALALGAMHAALNVCAAAGTVVTVKWSTSGYGYHIIINHGDGIQTLYAHYSNLYVTVGQYVNQGDIIAAMGSTGNSTGTHLHFEVRVNGQYVNPKNYVSK